MGVDPGASPGPEAERRRAVLVVEDEILVRLAISDYLRDVGFAVVEAKTAEEAKAVIVSGTDVDAIFTDVRLPGDMDGLALADWIGRHRPGLPVLVTSGSFSLREPERLASRQFLAKPYIFYQVERRLRALLAAG